MYRSKASSRALRRHHAARLKKARKNYWGYARHEWSARTLGLVLWTPKNCSCFGCGNARRHFGERTMQERRVLQHDLAEHLRDVEPVGKD